MRGHEPLLAMRRRGLKPRMVFIAAFEDSAKEWRDWPVNDQAKAQIEVLPSEPLSSLDLRCVVGLPVLITGPDRRRVEALRNLCVEAAASRVVAAVTAGDDTNITDTADWIRT